jgi:hypothetical protein
MPRQHHPIADLFPMLAEDELKELAADIAERGLLQPIVLDGEGRILDGRNRVAACELAGIEPEFSTYMGDDPDGFALAVNIRRRNLTKGQQAMVIAGAYKNYTQEHAGDFGVSKQYVSWARIVHEYAPELASAVRAGHPPLAEAYKTALERKQAVESAESAMARLRAQDAELADRVVEGELTLAGAFATLEEHRREAERQEEARRREEHLRSQVAEIDKIRDADGAPAPTFADRAENGSITWGEAVALAQQWRAERADAIKRAQNSAVQLVNHWGVIQTIRDQASTPYVADILAGLGENDRGELNRIITDLKG